MNRSYYDRNQDFGQPLTGQLSTYAPSNMPPEYPQTTNSGPGPESQTIVGPAYRYASRSESRDPSMSLQLPSQHYRPRSASPLSRDRHSGSESQSPTRSSSFSPRARSVGEKARNKMNDTFSTSAAGLGVALLGAVVGGVVAHEASEAASRHHAKQESHSGRQSSSKDHRGTKTVATIIGAVAGGLGANALEKLSEDSRRREKRRELVENIEQWQRKSDGSGSGRRDDRYEYDSSDDDYYDEKKRHGRRKIDDY